jgi:hypothetical protein
MYALCMRIQDEKDPKKFNCLVEELERLLNTKRECIQASESFMMQEGASGRFSPDGDCPRGDSNELKNLDRR